MCFIEGLLANSLSMFYQSLYGFALVPMYGGYCKCRKCISSKDRIWRRSPIQNNT